MESETLVLRLDGFEGPLDLLLELARAQKVDLAKISILALVEQFLAVIEPDEAPAVFRQSTAAFRKLGRDAEAEQVEAMLRDLNNPQQNPGNE